MTCKVYCTKAAKIAILYSVSSEFKQSVWAEFFEIINSHLYYIHIFI